MAKNDIKVIAPSSNPHICYIPRSCEEQVKYVKEKTGKSMYRILCESAGVTLSTKEKIKQFKENLRKLGYRNIGEWAVELIDKLYYMKEITEIPKPTKRRMKP